MKAQRQLLPKISPRTSHLIAQSMPIVVASMAVLTVLLDLHTRI